MSEFPKITVLMAAYNGEQYLREAVDSVLMQSFRDFELLVIDDGSTDATPRLLDEYAARDARVRVHHQPNAGFIASLNTGIKLARGEYIARLDPDDVCMPERLHLQGDYLDHHPEIGIVGAWQHFISDTGQYLSCWRVPCTPGGVRWRLLFENVLGHSAVMARREILERCRYYSPEALYVEDYDLWSRALQICEIANIPVPLIRYRIHSASVSRQHADEQERNCLQVVQRNVTELLGETVPTSLLAHLRNLTQSLGAIPPAEVRELDALLHSLFSAFRQRSPLPLADEREVRDDLSMRLHLCAFRVLRHQPAYAWQLLRKALAISPRLPLTRIFHAATKRWRKRVTSL